MLKKIKKTNKTSNFFINKKETKKILYLIKNIKKSILEIYSGNNYIIKSIIKKNIKLKILSIEKEEKNIKNLKNISKNIKKKKKNKKKKKYSLILMNPPYLNYKNINIKKICFEPLKSLTNFKIKNKIKKIIKKKIIKKNSKILIENEKYKKL